MFRLGALIATSASARPDLLARPTFDLLAAEGLLEEVGVVEIDPALSDTSATSARYDLSDEFLANCVVVGGKRDGVAKTAAVVVLASTRADINNTVKRMLDVRKASFLPMDEAVRVTEMEFGGITPVGMPADWPIFVDSRVIESDLVVIGSGVRRSKIILPGAVLARVPGTRVVEGLGLRVGVPEQ
jgi:prolyl-tRNA editing enzyme YbaK/EbsC (Cys-tRNA(Pro) deacylase)